MPDVELGAGTLTYGVAIGAMVTLTVVFATIPLLRRRLDPVYLTLSGVAAASAVAAVSTVRLHTSSSIEEYAEELQIFGVASLVSLVATVALITAWTRIPYRRALIAFVVASLVVLVLQVTLPDGGLLAEDITALREVQLFGESFVVHDASRSVWRPVLDIYLVFATCLIVVGLVRGVRVDGWRRSSALVVGTGVGAAVGAYDSLVDSGVAATPYLAPFASLALVALGASRLAVDITTTHERLAAQTVHLEELVVERTAALIDANERLAHEVDRQRQSERELAQLAGRFEAVNSMTLDDDRTPVGATLKELLGDLGQLTDATSVRVELSGIAERVSVGDEVSWSLGDSTGGDDGSAGIDEPLELEGVTIGHLELRFRERRVSEQHRRYIELTAEHLAGFLGRLVLVDEIAATAVAEERKRITRELHDSVTQKLYSASFLADGVPSRIGADPVGAAGAVDRLRRILLTALAELRTLMFELDPTALDQARLRDLLDQLSQSYGDDGPVSVDAASVADGDLPIAVKTGLYRIAQEALTNAVRHSDATQIRIDLRSADGDVELVVHDNGCGFDPATASSGRGFENMSERATAISAQLSVDSVPGHGTTVAARWGPATSDAAAARTELVSAPTEGSTT